jgi:chemotaxis protein MotB
MAKKKQEDAPKGSPAWMATFSDLMNLLLCFFVLLFSMSSVDANKWNEVVQSINSSFSIFTGGYTSVGEGLLIGSGTSQLSDLDEYYQSMGQASEDKNGEDINDNPSDNPEQSIEDKIYQANKGETEKILDEISENLDMANISGYVDIAMDKAARYVELTVSGGFLFDSGSANIKDSVKPILSKLGDVLKIYDKYMIEIIGHTDNVPMYSVEFRSNDELSSGRAISVKNYLVNVKGLDIKTMKWSGRGEYDPVASNATPEGRARNRRVEIRVYNSLNSD